MSHYSYIALSLSYVVADESSECSNWYYHPAGLNHCKCGQSLPSAVMCSEGEVYLRVDYTMTLILIKQKWLSEPMATTITPP